jgi:hypothetical protein
MRNHTRTARPQRQASVARQISRRATVTRTLTRVARPSIRRYAPLVLDLASFPIETEASPYLDYGRHLTPEGGVLIAYKDLDLRLRHIIARVFLWGAYTWLEGWYLLNASPLESQLINYACLFAMAALNLLIVWKLPEMFRSVEIRHDCMILDQTDVFWLRLMENLPTFRPDEEGKKFVLSGIYGTRYVEYLTTRRFDDKDRMPEVFVAHLKDAIHQLWEVPNALGTRESDRSAW